MNRPPLEKFFQISSSAGKIVVNFLSTTAMLCLFTCAMISSFSHWYDEINDYTTLLLEQQVDHIIGNIIMLLLMLLFVFLFFCCFTKFVKKERDRLIFRCGIAAFMLILSISLVVNLDVVPMFDRAAVIGHAQAALAGNWEGFEPSGYMTCFPQQIGIVSTLYLLMKLIPEGWWYYQIINCLALTGMVIVGGALSRKLWKNTAADSLYVLLQFTCIPAYLYACFVYGEMITSFLCICTIYMIIDVSEQENKKISKLVMIMFLMFGAVWLRPNASITIIALLLCVVWKMMAERQKSYLKIMIALLLSFGIYKAAGNLIFSNHIKHYDSMPAIAFIVEGMEKNSMGYGAYNAFGQTTFEATGYNAELTKQESYKMLRLIAEYYLDYPKEAVVFFANKVAWQWTAPDYEGILSTCQFNGNEFFKRFYYGDLRVPLWNILNWHQNLVYFGLLFAFLREWKNKNNGLQIIFQVIFLGYFFFSAIWEAKPRYTVMCYFMMLPMAAYGLWQFCAETERLVKKTARSPHFLS